MATQAPESQPATAGRSEAEPHWVVGWINKPTRRAMFRNAPTVERSAVILSLVLGSGLTLFATTVDGYLMACLLSLFAGNLVLLKRRYEAEPDVGRLMELTEQEKVLARHVHLVVADGQPEELDAQEGGVGVHAASPFDSAAWSCSS